MPSRWPATATSKSEGKKTMKYPCLPGLTPDGTVYQNSAMGTVEAMLPPGPWATAHAPALLETPDGSLLCAWFAGSFEGSGDVSIVCARLPKGGKLLPPAHPGACKWTLDIRKLAVQRQRIRSGRRPDGVSDLRRSGLYLAHCRDAGQQRPCTCQCGGACAGTSRGVHAEPCGRFHLSQ